MSNSLPNALLDEDPWMYFGEYNPAEKDFVTDALSSSGIIYQFNERNEDEKIVYDLWILDEFCSAATSILVPHFASKEKHSKLGEVSNVEK